MRKIYLFCCIVMMCQLQGCMNAAFSGASAAYNHRSIQSNLTDEYISYQADRRLFGSYNQFKDCHIDIATFNRTVLLVGQVANKELQKKAQSLVESIPKVRKVYNFTEVREPISSLSSAGDIWITTKIRSRLVAYNEIDPDKIKVVTEDGVVYLMGIVMRDQADLAIDIARHTDGVDKVVTLFIYLKISKDGIT